MNTRAWKITWEARPTPDGNDRLGRAVQWVVEHSVDAAGKTFRRERRRSSTEGDGDEEPREEVQP